MAAWRRLTFAIAESAVEDLVVCLHEAGSLGAEVVKGQVVAWFPGTVDERSVLETLRVEMAAGSSDLSLIGSEPVADGFWHERWMETLAPFEVGRRFLVMPGPATPADRRGRLLLRLTPGRAFGTGEHATTRMCLGMLEESVRPGDTLLDIGTGSGILSIAAILLGAGVVVGLDTDAGAVEVAARNATVNDARGILFLAGSLDALSSARHDLVVANITGTTLERVMPALARRVKRAAILSGILLEEESRLVELAGRSSLSLAERRHDGDWVALRLERRENG